jgi:hypothetical protein
MKKKLLWITILIILIISILGINFYLNNGKLPEGEFNLCYYYKSKPCLDGGGKCGMSWAASPSTNPNSCKTDKDCLILPPSYKKWSLREVDCREDNRKGCLKDSDCVQGGTCCYIKTCYNKDYWEDYIQSNCEGLCDEIQKDSGYPFESCSCINNYCREVN